MHLYQYRFTVSYLMVYNPLLPLSTLVLKLSMIWPVGLPLKLAFVLFFTNLHHSFWVHTFWHNMFKIHFLKPSSEINHFPNEPWFLWVRASLETKIWGLCVLLVMGELLPAGSKRGFLETEEVKAFSCTYGTDQIENIWWCRREIRKWMGAQVALSIIYRYRKGEGAQAGRWAYVVVST